MNILVNLKKNINKWEAIVLVVKTAITQIFKIK